jgi:hypothetical protein
MVVGRCDVQTLLETIANPRKNLGSPIRENKTAKRALVQ